MKILHLEASSGWGGQEIRILRESIGMRERGHEVILGVAKGGKLVNRAREAGFTVYELNFRKAYWPLTLLKLMGIMRGVDVVNTHSSLDSWIGGIAGRLSGKKIVRTRHLSTPIREGWNAKTLYGKLADEVVTTCASIVPVIAKYVKCSSVPTGVDPLSIQFAQEDVAKFRFGAEFLVGTACFMRSWKGLADLLKAADALRGVEGLKWVVIGGGHEETYRQMAREMNLEGIVHFTGHLDNPFAAIAALDVFMLLSTAHEGVSQAILQAGFLGKPLIATKVGGLGEVCIDQETGLSVAPFAPDEVAEAVIKLKNDPALVKRFGENARRLVESEFTMKTTLEKMGKVFENAL